MINIEKYHIHQRMDIFGGPHLPSPVIFFDKNYGLWEIKILKIIYGTFF